MARKKIVFMRIDRDMLKKIALTLLIFILGEIMKKHIMILKLVCTSFIFLSLFGCSSDQQAKEIMNQNETEFEIKEYSFVPRTTFVQYFTESYGEHNDVAKLIYDGINQKSTDIYTDIFASREDADQFFKRV